MTQPITGILLILHGSPRPEANQPAIDLALELAGEMENSLVTVACLECNHPTIREAVDDMARQHVSRIIAIPYFLHTGRHLVLDIPRILQEASQKYQHISIEMTNPVGEFPGVTTSLAYRAAEAK